MSFLMLVVIWVICGSAGVSVLIPVKLLKMPVNYPIPSPCDAFYDGQ